MITILFIIQFICTVGLACSGICFVLTRLYYTSKHKQLETDWIKQATTLFGSIGYYNPKTTVQKNCEQKRLRANQMFIAMMQLFSFALVCTWIPDVVTFIRNYLGR